MTNKCLVIDDEPLAREVLEGYIRKVPSLELAASCKNAIEAISLARTLLPDIIFCDIKMPELTGLEFIRMLDKPPAIIITTAYQQYAVEGFELGVTDYLVKPVRFERFLKAIGRASGQPLRANNNDALLQQEVIAADKFIFFKTDGEFVKVFLKDIHYIEAYGNYVLIHIDKKKLIVKDKISAIEDLLDKNQFVRIHKSYIIAVGRIEKVFGNMVTLANTELPVGSFYKKEFMRVAGFSS